MHKLEQDIEQVLLSNVLQTSMFMDNNMYHSKTALKESLGLICKFDHPFKRERIVPDSVKVLNQIKRTSIY